MSGRRIGPHRVADDPMPSVLGHRFRDVTGTRIIETTSLRCDEERFERALRRLEVVDAIDSPHLVPILDAGLDGELLYVVTPSPDHTANELPAIGTAALEPHRAVAAGLDALHEAGVLHRDLQLRHVGWYGDTVRLDGCGLLDVIGPGGTQGIGPIGAADTMAPSIVCGRSATRGSDIYSLGAALHLLAVGRAVHPYLEESLTDRLQRIAAEPPQVADSCPTAVRRAVIRALEADGETAPADTAAETLADTTRSTQPEGTCP